MSKQDNCLILNPVVGVSANSALYCCQIDRERETERERDRQTDTERETERER